jgi:hypothetical protein
MQSETSVGNHLFSYVIVVAALAVYEKKAKGNVP